MSPAAIAAISFACVLGGVLLGVLVRMHLPAHHLSSETQNAIKLGMGMVATVSGLVLGLLVATAKSSFDTRDSEIKQACARLVLLDHALARYGPETAPTRQKLRQLMADRIDQLWPPGHAHATIRQADETTLEDIEEQIEQLPARNAREREQRARVLAIASDLAQTRWLMIEQSVGSALPRPFLVIVTFWLTILFFSFGLVAPRNATAISVLIVCALCVATALFLVLEMDRPFGGLIQISSEPARQALAQMGRQ
jgi:hypothetical protein